jgi:hypothetical protein
MGLMAATSSPLSSAGSRAVSSASSWCSRLPSFHYSVKVSQSGCWHSTLAPNFLSELTERGAGKALLRLGMQFLSTSPVFEVFATHISSQWSSLYRHRLRVRDDQDFLQHPLLSIRWPEHLPWYEDPRNAPLHDHDLMDPVDHILLGIDPGPLRSPVPVQSSSILVCGFLH